MSEWGVTYAVPLQEKTAPSLRQPGLGEPHRCFNLFHFAIWLGGNPDVTNFQLVSSFSTAAPLVEMKFTDITVLFGKKADRTRFLRWFHKYGSKFAGQSTERAYMPTLPTSGKFRLIFAESSVNDYGDGFFRMSEELAQMWMWLAHNSKGYAFRTATGFAFTDEKTAIEFKLRFPV